MILFFLLGLIAGGLLCRRGPQGERGLYGPPGAMGPPGRDSVDCYSPESGPTGARPNNQSLYESLYGLHLKVDQLRRAYGKTKED